jgi:hypothetical protein
MRTIALLNKEVKSWNDTQEPPTVCHQLRRRFFGQRSLYATSELGGYATHAIATSKEFNTFM